jgi:hypothetical protein
MKAQKFTQQDNRDLWFWIATLAGFAVFALLEIGVAGASVPPQAAPAPIQGLRITDDTALYQNISEINSPRLGHVDFDSDLQRLSQMERQYVDRARIRLPQTGNVRGKTSRAVRR